eukprot:5380429-Pyramimonas_sp.AAC.1
MTPRAAAPASEAPQFPPIGRSPKRPAPIAKAACGGWWQPRHPCEVLEPEGHERPRSARRVGLA